MSVYEKFGGEITVNTTYARTQAQSEVTHLASGRFVVTWVDADFTVNGNYYIRAQVFAADGSPSGAELTLAGPDSYRLEEPSIAALDDGGFLAAWRDGTTLMVQRYDGDGAPAGAVVNVVALDDSGAVEIAATPGGGFALAWIDEDQPHTIRLRTYDASGAMLSGFVTVNGSPVEAYPTEVGLSVAALAGGNVVVTWYDMNTASTADNVFMARIFTAAGVPLGGEFAVNLDPAADHLSYGDAPVIALGNGNFAISWTQLDAGEITNHIQLFTAAGVRVGAPILTAVPMSGGAVIGSRAFLTPALAELADGSLVVVHANTAGGLTVEIYDATGAAIGGPIAVETQANGEQSDPSIAALADGGFVVTWTDYNGEGIDDDQVKAQVFGPVPFVISSNGGGDTAVVSVSENGLAVSLVTTTGTEGPLSFAIAGGADAAKFAIDAASGALSFVGAPNFEAPADADGNNVYEVIVSASDGTYADTQAISVAISNVSEAPVITSNGGGSSAMISVSENATAVTTVVASDPENGVTYQIAGGADWTLFTIDLITGALSFKGAPNFEVPTDTGGNNVYDVIVRASDGTLSDTQALAVSVGNVNEFAPNIAVYGSNASLSRPENSVLVEDFDAPDADGNPVSFSISGADAAKFTIDAVTGVLQFKTAPNYEAAGSAAGTNSYQVTVSASDGLYSDSVAITVIITNVNDAPVITSGGGGASAAISIAENMAVVTTVTSTDQEGTVRTYSIIGGVDAARLSINASTGAMFFVSNQDFENPADVGGDNVYDVIVQASDGSLVDTQALAITVTNVDEAPVITSNGGGTSAAVSVNENTTFVTTVIATDPENAPRTYSLSGGADAARFTIDAATGVLSFVSAPNRETPTDVGANNVYDVIVRASDGFNIDTQSIAVTVNNVNEAPVITSNGGGATAAITVSENTATVTTVTSTDPENTTRTYSIVGGADAARFAINSTSGTLAFFGASNFEAPTDANGDNVYEVSVRASDGGLWDDQALSITVTNVNDAPVITSNGGGATAAISVSENSLAVTTVTSTDDENTARTYSISGGADSTLFTINASTGALSFVTAPNFEAPIDSGGNNVYDVIVRASDGVLADTQTIAVTITGINEAPLITSNGGGASASVTVTANTAIIATVHAVDPDNTARTYSISGGADATLFAINAATGALSFVTAPDFHAPGDVGANNVYDVIVAASDGSLTDSQAMAVTVAYVRDEPRVSYQRSGAEFSVNTNTASNQTFPRIAGFADGRFVVVWQTEDTTQDGSGGAIKAQLFAADGTKSGSELLVNTATASTQEMSDVAVLDNGRFVVTWATVNASQDGSSGAIKAQMFEANGAAVGSEFLVNSVVSGNQYRPEITSLAGGGFAISWMDANTTDIKAQVYNASGVRVGGEFAVNNLSAAVQQSPAISSLSNGNFIATWATTDSTIDGSGDAVQARLFSGTGSAIGSEFTVNTQTTAFQNSPAIAGLANGGFVSVWLTADTAQDGYGTAIKAQVFSASGAKVGPEFLVNDQPFGSQSRPHVTATADGGFMVAWVASDLMEDGSGSAIKARTFGASGAPTTDEFLVNSLATGDQTLPRVETLADGRVVAIWASASGDSSGLSIRGQVIGANEAPVISSNGGGLYGGVTLAEGQINVATVAATDHNGTAPLGYAIIGGRDAALFAIDAATGALSFVGAPDFESPADFGGNNVYDVIVSAGDGGLVDTQALTITIVNVNEAPVITSGGGGASATVTVDENDTAVTTVASTDPENAARTYAIAGGADAALFAIDAATGALSFVGAPDFEVPADANGDNVYQVTVQASDGALSDAQTISVTVGNVNEAPTIVSGTVFAAVENGLAAATVVAADVDGTAPSYAIAGGADAALFAIDTVTGVLSFVSPPNFEAPTDANGDNAYEVVVSASDGSLSDTKAFSIVVGNVNETPVITSSPSISVSENGTAVATVAAADPEGGVTYALAGGTDAALFAIDAATGALSFITAPDREAPGDSDADNVYEVVVSASDGALSDQQAVSVTVANVNEAPVIVSNGGGATASVAVSENGTAVTAVAAIDPEGGVTYAIAGGADSARFAIDAATGALAFFTAPDRELPGDTDGDNVYQVVVSASDGSLADTQALSVVVSNADEAPVITSSASVAVSENDTAVITVTAVDLEGGLTYALAGGADSALFAIDAGTGALSFIAAPDFEAPADADGDNVYEVEVSASDGSLADTQALTVTVSNANEAPVIASSAAISLGENATAVTTVSAADPEGGVSYSLAGGADAALFAIDASTGALSFVAAPDFEMPGDADGDNVYEVAVNASDGSLVDTQALAVSIANLNDNAPVIALFQYDSMVSAMTENNVSYFDFDSTDADGDTVVFSLAGQDAASFTVNAATGLVQFLAAPDFEAPGSALGTNSYVFDLLASDGSFSDVLHVTLHVSNANEPLSITSDGGGAQAAVTVAEHATAVTTVVASDLDLTAPTYAIAGGADAARFAIDAVTGALSFVAPADFEAPGDADGDNVYQVTVSAGDGTLSDTQSLSVTVGNVNEAPVIGSNGGGASAALAVSENSTTVTTVAATDPEGNVTYALAGGADAARFTINAGTGALSFLAAPNFEAPSDADGNNVYEVVVSASDGSLVDTQALLVTVGNLNDEGPVISSNGGGDWAALAVNENSATVTTVAVTAPGGSVTYALAGGADAARFTINAVTGALRFVAAPNFEAPSDADGNNVYKVVVSASDGSLVDTQELAVTVGNVNEAPVITSGGGGATATYGVSENTTAAIAIVASDPEGAVTYAIAGGSDAVRFTIDQGTGSLRFVSAPDYEAPTDSDHNNSYQLVVSASDGSLTDTQSLIVSVTNLSGSTINGSSGSETLTGTSEDDTLRGNAGNDTLIGLGGADQLTGGTQADRFVYNALSDSTLATSDRILDFSRSQGDRIDLSAIDANAALGGNQSFNFISGSAFSGSAGQLRYFQQGSDTIVQGDVTGDGMADFQIVLDTPVSLGSVDFVL